MNFSHMGFALATSLIMSAASAAVTTSTFDELPLAPESHHFPAATGTFTSGAATFNHDYQDFGFAGCCWSGWTYANGTDTTTSGFGNQYSAFAGSGVDGSANYALAYLGSPTVTLATPSVVSGLYVTNTTYAALSMLQGDAFAKKFGGATGDDADFLRLTITGIDALSQQTGQVDVYLADYRFSDNSQDYVLKDWSFVDLSSLGAVSSLRFAMASSDVGDFGMNTPSYFAVDNLSVSAVPEAGSGWMLLVGLTLTSVALRRRRSA